MRMIEGWNHGVAFFLDQALRLDFGFVLGFADDTGFSTERSNTLELILGHQL